MSQEVLVILYWSLLQTQTYPHCGLHITRYFFTAVIMYRGKPDNHAWFDQHQNFPIQKIIFRMT